MAFFGAVILLTFLSHISLASSNEASSISTQSVYQKVRFRVRDIVGMLSSVQQQVTKDGQEDAELFGKYMFYCRKGKKYLETAIEEAENTDLDSLKSAIEAEEENRDGIQNHIEEDQAQRADAEAAIVKAKTLRDVDATVFKEESGKLRKDIATMKTIIRAFDKEDGLDDSRRFLAVPLLKELSGCSDTKQSDRDLLKTFLQKLKVGSKLSEKEEMRMFLRATDIMSKKLATLVGEEKTEIDDFRAYKDGVKKKTKALFLDIKAKTTAVQELDEQMNTQKDDLEDAARYLMEGRAFLPFIHEKENCSIREDEWADRCQLRTAELAAIAESVSFLTDEEFLDDLLKKGLPEPWQEGDHHALLAAKESNRSSETGKAQFDLMSFALKGKNASVAKLFRVLDGMAAMLGKDKPNAHPEKLCGQSINQTEDNLKRLTLSVSGLGAIIARHEQSISTLTQEIDETQAGIQTLEQQVLDTGKVRKQEHHENSEVLTSDNMTLQLFATARDRLHSFYSHEDVPEEEIEGVTLGEVIGPYVKKRDESALIISMLDTTVTKLRAELTRLQIKEKEDQEAWETSISVSVEKHAHGMKAISDKQEAKADLELTLDSAGKEKKEKMQEVKASNIYLSELQGNNTGFLRPVVCERKPTRPDNTEPIFPKHIPLW